ncbi:MAG TPA: amidohydrolase family protein [Ilumatobacteraceae bacterium]|nr:amidohydrolase family protein [Ilumatobacteraceae bacterium]
MDQPREWWPELAPKWEPTTAPRPPGVCIDVHTHLRVPAAAALAEPHYRPELEPRNLYSSDETLRYNRELQATPLQLAQFEEPEARIADMDKQGVDMQVLSVAPPQYYYWLEPGLALRACRLQHERFAEIVAQHPTRFAAVANLPMDHPAIAVEVMREAKHDFGFNGFEISADVNGGDLDDRRYDPVWEHAVELDMTVILHPQGFTHGERMRDYYLVNVLCMPLASTLAVSRMILGGVWQRHPDLRMLVVHGGGYLPFYFGRTDHAFRVRPELRKHIDRPPSEYLHKLHFDTAVFEPRMVEHLVDEFGADRVLLGTDYPFDMSTTDPLAFLAGADLDATTRALIVGGNAARLFQLDVKIDR